MEIQFVTRITGLILYSVDLLVAELLQNKIICCLIFIMFIQGVIHIVVIKTSGIPCI